VALQDVVDLVDEIAQELRVAESIEITDAVPGGERIRFETRTHQEHWDDQRQHSCQHVISIPLEL
jgi:hypothetical protein